MGKTLSCRGFENVRVRTRRAVELLREDWRIEGWFKGGRMIRRLGDFRIGDWVLTLDLLGTKYQMSEANWLSSLNDLLYAISLSVKEALSTSTEGLHLVHYGDSVSFTHADADVLVALGVSLQTELFHRDILAQLALAGGGAYYVDDTTTNRLVQDLPNIKLHCLVGPAVARSHLVMQGAKGPRFLVDEESGHLPAKGPTWSKVLFGPKTGGILQCSDIRWWEHIPDVPAMTAQRIAALQARIKSEQESLREFQHMKSDVEREINSLQKRLDHYIGFKELLEKDAGY
jgi:hypothetical protein